MATATIEALVGISGLTLLVDLYPLGSDTISLNGGTLTEATNRKGLYTGTFTSTGFSGEYQAFVYPSGSVSQRVYVGYVNITDAASLHRIVDNAADASVDITGCSSNVGAFLGTVSKGAAGYAGMDWGQMTNLTAVTTLTNTTIATSQVIATVTNQLTAAAIATGVWEDTTAGGDFGTAGSIGLLLVTNVNATIGSRLATSGYTAPTNLTAAQIATGVWQDATAGDFTVSGSIGKSLFTSGNAPGAASGLALVGSNMGSASSVTAAITLPAIPNNWISAAGIAANALNGKGDWLLAVNYTAPPTSAQTATAVWQDSTAGDFTAAGSIGKSLAPATLGAVPGASGGFLIAGANAATTFATLTSTGAFTVNGVSNVSQTGDSFARIGALGAGLTGITGVTLAASQPGVTIPTVTTVTNQLTAAVIGGAVWDVTLSGHLVGGSTGAALNAAGSAGDPWSTLIPGAYGAGTAGNLVGNNLATILTNLNSLVTTVGAAGAGLTALASATNLATANTDINALITTVGVAGAGLTALAPASTALSSVVWTNARAGYQDNLNVGGNVASSSQSVTLLGAIATVDADVLTRLAATSYTVPPTAAAIQLQVFNGLVDGTYSLRQCVKAAAAGAGGALTGGPGPSLAFKSLDGTTAFTCTVDSSGDRSGFNYTL
jgi:hypothetical protein